MANTKTAAKTAKDLKTERDKQAEQAAADRELVQEADAEFRETVQKAGEKRDKKLAKVKTRSSNIAEQAWNDTKAEDDPPYNAVAVDHRNKLDYAVQTIRDTGNADIAGLELFEQRVKELLEEEDDAQPSTALNPASTTGRPTEEK